MEVREKENELRELAKLAKARLKSGFWNERKEKIKSCLSGEEDNPFAEDIVKQYFKASYVLYRRKTQEELEDERMYQKVCQIIDEDDGLNPIGRLIDRERYEKMNSEEKQRYVFELSDRYQRLQQKYYREKEIEMRLKRLARI